MSSRARQHSRAQRRLADMRRQQRTRRRRTSLLIAVAGILVAVTATALAIVLSMHSAGTRGTAGRPSVSGQLAGLRSMATGAPVDAIQCDNSEQDVYHIHAHLSVFADGTRQGIPAQIGVPGSCLYWLHTHDPSGVVHIESPIARTYTLGDFFDIWGQPLTASQAGIAKGAVTAYLNGVRYRGDPRTIPLRPHAVIQLDVGTDVAPQPYRFAPGI